MRFVLALALLFAAGCGGQSVECKKYLECANAVLEGAGDALNSKYGAQGSCWSTSQEAADACTRTCKSAVADVVAAGGAPQACQ
jgi:hypothetical protein